MARAAAIRSSSAEIRSSAFSRVALSLTASAGLRQTIHRIPGVESSFASLTSRWSSTGVNRPCRASAAAAAGLRSRIRSPAIQCPPPRRRQAGFASEEKPRSATVTTRPSFQSRIPSRTSGSTETSVVFPGCQHQQRAGIPSLLTAGPMTTCGRSGRWSLEWPRRRNPSSRRSVSKYDDVVSNISRSTSRFSRFATEKNTASCTFAVASAPISRSIAR